MNSWHVTPSMLEAYAQDRIEVAVAFSVEAHLESCDTCRLEMADFVDAERLAAVWQPISDTIAQPERGVMERALIHLGVKDHIARLLAATRALRTSWFLAIGVVLSIAIGASYGAEDGYLLFLLVTPLLPVAGVAASYGPGIDPTYEIGIAAPIRGFHLLLMRTIAVVVATMLAAGAAAIFLPDVNWSAPVAWLLPALGLVTATLALSTFTSPLKAAGIVGFIWTTGVGASLRLAYQERIGASGVFGETMQVLFVVVIMSSLVLLTARRSHFERGEPL